MSLALILAAALSADCVTIADFSDPEERARWSVVNDGVMGGLSRGFLEEGDEALRFRGEIVTDGGGFSSIRRTLARGELAGMTSLRVTMQGDARDYQISLRSDQAYRGRRVAFRARLTSQEAGWAEAEVAMADLSPSIFGQPLRGGPFDTASAREIGFILADGQDGNFVIDLRRIEACR